MKLGPATKIDERNKATSKNLGDDVISRHCGIIAIILIYDQFGAIWKLDSGRIIKLTFLLIVTFYLTKMGYSKRIPINPTQIRVNYNFLQDLDW